MPLDLPAMTLFGLALGALGGFGVALLARRIGRDRNETGTGSTAETLVDLFRSCLIAFDRERVELLAGAETLEAIATSLGLADCTPAAVVESLAMDDPLVEQRLQSLRTKGEAFALETAGLEIEGRTSGALAILRLSSSRRASVAGAGTVAAFVGDRPEPCWITDAAGTPLWVNQAWLAAVGAETLAEARERQLSLDGEADRIALDAARTRQPRTILRWVHIRGERRALRFRAQPLEGGAGARPKIAGELSVSVNTVSTHVRSIYAKLQVRDRASAVQRARELRLLAAGRGANLPRRSRRWPGQAGGDVGRRR